ncbi:hypothetical protein ACFL2J_05530 [Candidatus Omnitrophota bacterium]
MKGRKLNLKAYFVQNTDPMTPDKKETEYDVKEGLANIITSPQQKHKGFRQLVFDDLARKVLNCKSDSIILEQAEYDMLHRCCDGISGYSRNDSELLRRVQDAPEVEMQEKKKK